MLVVKRAPIPRTCALRQGSDGKLGRRIPEQIVDGFYDKYISKAFLERVY